MARWFCLYLILFIFLFGNIKMMILSDQHNRLERNIGLARENRYRAQQRIGNHMQLQQPSLISPDVLRDRWIELYKKKNKKNQT